MKTKYLLLLLIITFHIFLHGCMIRFRPIYPIPTPHNTYGNNQASISFYLSPVAHRILDIQITNFLTTLDFQINDTLMSVLYTQEESSSYSSYSFGIFLGKNFWLRSESYEYPWGCVYAGIRPSVVFYGELNNYNPSATKNTYFPIDLNFGFKPGIYSKSYNINLLLRGSVGLTIPLGYYFSGGIGFQGNIYLDNIGLGLNIEFAPAIGGIQFNENYGAALLGLAPLINLYLLVKF